MILRRSFAIPLMVFASLTIIGVYLFNDSNFLKPLNAHEMIGFVLMISGSLIAGYLLGKYDA